MNAICACNPGLLSPSVPAMQERSVPTCRKAQWPSPHGSHLNTCICLYLHWGVCHTKRKIIFWTKPAGISTAEPLRAEKISSNWSTGINMFIFLSAKRCIGGRRGQQIKEPYIGDWDTRQCGLVEHAHHIAKCKFTEGERMQEKHVWYIGSNLFHACECTTPTPANHLLDIQYICCVKWL